MNDMIYYNLQMAGPLPPSWQKYWDLEAFCKETGSMYFACRTILVLGFDLTFIQNRRTLILTNSGQIFVAIAQKGLKT